MTEEVLEETALAPSELIELFKHRSATYGLLSRLYAKEVDAELLDELHDTLWPIETGTDAGDTGNRLIATYLSGIWENTLTELAADYMRTFFGHGYSGHAAAYPFESVYSSEKRLLMQSARDEVLALYRAAGLSKQESWKEGEDHIALELEFMQRMALRAAEALDDAAEDEAVAYLRTSYDFLENHLLNWVPMLVADMRMHARTLFYQGLGQLTFGTLQEDETVLRELLDSVEA